MEVQNKLGVDMFDASSPRATAATATPSPPPASFMRNEKHRLDDQPLEADCDCEACRGFSRAYIRHMFNAGEMLGPTLTSIHNLRFYQRFMARVRELIPAGKLFAIIEEFPIAMAKDLPLAPEETP